MTPGPAGCALLTTTTARECAGCPSRWAAAQGSSISTAMAFLMSTSFRVVLLPAMSHRNERATGYFAISARDISKT